MGEESPDYITTEDLMEMDRYYAEKNLVEKCDWQPPKFKRASLVFPVVNGILYVGKRMKNPKAGFFGPIGGRPDSRSENHLSQMPQLVVKQGGMKQISCTDSVCELLGLEYTNQTVRRETCEEVFYEKKYPNDFSESDITDVIRFGFIMDPNKDYPEIPTYSCDFHIATVNRRDFSLKPDELSDFKPLFCLAPNDRLYPLAGLALFGLADYLKTSKCLGSIPYSVNLIKQIPRFDYKTLINDIRGKFSNMWSLSGLSLLSGEMLAI